MTPEFTIIIPCSQPPALLLNCLNALGQQTLLRHQFEIIVIDDENDAETARTVQAFARLTGIETRYLPQPQRRGMAAARNRGWRAARGRVVVFTDEDTVPQADWLSAALIPFKRGAQVVAGQMRILLPSQVTSRSYPTAAIETIDFTTANCFCLRSVMDRVGGFEETFDRAWHEDSDLQFKLLELGIPIMKCPEVVASYLLKPTAWRDNLRDERNSRYDALLYKRHPDLFRKRISVHPTIVLQYYVAVLSVFAGLVAVLSGNYFTALASFGAWLLLTLDLIASRIPDGHMTWRNLKDAVLTGLPTPFLSVYWRLYGAFKYRVLYW